jgi:surfactin family lipopeptide synthetase A
MPDENILENIEDVYPMSDIEKGMVFHSIKESHISQFHNQLMNQVKVTDFSPGVFKKALLLMIKKHIILRTTFDMYGYEEPVQLVHKGMSPDYQHFDISHLDKSCREEYINNILKEDREKSFDINSINPLWRMKSFKLDEKNVCILWLSHHALMDGWSRATFLTDLNNTYMKLKTNPDYTPPGLKSSYKDFVIEQIMCKKNEKFIEFWQKELEDYKRYEFPPNAARIGIEDHRYLYKNYTRHYEEPFVEKLNAAARRYDTSIKHLCFSAFSYMLTMISYEDDITVGLLVNNRPVCEDGDKIVGCFLNSIPVRMKIPARVKWSDYIRTMDQKMIQLIKYGKLSLNEIVKVIGERHQPDQHNPIFDTLFNYTDFHVYSQVDRENIAAPGKAEQLSLDLRLSSNIPFNFDVGYSGYMSVTLSSANEIVSSELTANLLCYFENILKQFIYEPESIAGKEQVLPLEEKQKLLYDFNNTKTDFPNDKTIPQLFAAVVEQEPHRIALAFENHQLTYRVLSEKANGLARRLKEKGIGPNNITGIMMERSLEMVIGIYGILNAGSAYLPIDPNYPAERVLYIMQDSESQILLTREYFRQNVIFNGETINISNELEYPNNRGGLESMNTPGDPVYVIYTSGSTGKPKGVMVKIESFVNLIHWYAEEFAFNHEDRVLLIASISFDLAQKNLFSPLIKGGQLFLASPGFYDYHQLSDTAAKKRVSIINCAPTMFYPLIEFNISRDFSRLKSLRYVFLGGEPIQVEKLMPWLDSDACQAEIVNTYGPTECTDIASFYRINPGNLKDRQTVPIGKPIHNVSIYILDKNHHLLPIGVVGELCIGGIGLSRGYYKQPELTKEKFVHTPHLPEQHVYCTGDMARWRKDGHIEFMGRIDHQVKIRGNRVELGEIETRLQKHESIKDAVVTIIEKSFPDGNKNEILCAYIVSAKEFDFSQLKEFLSKQLPEYMIPSYFVSLEALPLTPSGKVDRKKLPHPDIVSTPRYTPPGNEIEKKLVEIWADLLSVEKDTLSIDADFFDLGGHSLSAMRLVSILSNTFNVKIPLRNFFQSGTIGNISEVIIKLKAEKNNEKEPTRKRKGLVRTFNLEQAPLFRAVAVKLQEGQHLLFFDMHHIITDGASMEVIADDFVRVYAGEPLPPLPLQYKEFAQWQNNFFDSEDYQEQQEYWLNCRK